MQEAHKEVIMNRKILSFIILTLLATHAPAHAAWYDWVNPMAAIRSVTHYFYPHTNVNRAQANPHTKLAVTPGGSAEKLVFLGD